MEEALRRFLPHLQRRKKPKRLRLLTFRGQGLTPEAMKMTPHHAILSLSEDDRA